MKQKGPQNIWWPFLLYESYDVYRANHDVHMYQQSITEESGGPNGNRTRVSGVRGQRPRPLDDGTIAKYNSKRETATTKKISGVSSFQ
jgi:hypothetical protein